MSKASYDTVSIGPNGSGHYRPDVPPLPWDGCAISDRLYPSIRSTTVAIPCPTPMHIVARP